MTQEPRTAVDAAVSPTGIQPHGSGKVRREIPAGPAHGLMGIYRFKRESGIWTRGFVVGLVTGALVGWCLTRLVYEIPMAIQYDFGEY